MSEIERFLNRWDYKHPTLTRSALEYARCGQIVIPLRDRSKIPRFTGWAKQETNDPHQIVDWFEQFPNSNIAIRMGDGLIALDIDTKNGGQKSYLKLRNKLEKIATAEAFTGSGGRHYLFRVDPGDRVKNITNLLPGVDIKSDRGYIVVYPSVHPDTGKDYVWLRGPERGIAHAPKWLMKMIRERTPSPKSDTSLPIPVSSDRSGRRGDLCSQIVERFPITAYGQRNGQMVRAIGRLIGENYDLGLVATVVRDWWRHFDEKGVIRTPLAEAETEIGKCIKATLANTSFKQTTKRDHRAERANIQVGEGQAEYIGRAIINRETETNTLLLVNSIRVKKRTKFCRNDREVAFVEAMIVYFTYKLCHLHEYPLKMTKKDLCLLMEDRRSLKFDPRQYEDNKVKYVNRPGKPATRFELAIQTVKGHQGKASEYQLTGLIQLLPPEAVAALQVHPSNMVVSSGMATP